jgi:hypothetical protein
MSTLHADVFERIVGRWRARADDIACFANARYSFEEWLNWEAYAACCPEPAWKVSPKPSYKKMGAADCKDFGDLLVAASDDRVLVEICLVHDGTGDKWLDKLAWDVQKLARPLDAGIVALHVVVLVSGVDIGASEGWQKWLRKVECWGRDTEFKAVVPLPPTGQMVVRAWATLPTLNSPTRPPVEASGVDLAGNIFQ